MKNLVIKYPTLSAAMCVLGMVFLLTVAPLLFCMYAPSSHQTTPDILEVVYLKSGGDFANYCKISNSSDYDRIVNFKNVSTIRKIEEKRLVVDNRLIILFEDSISREKFIKEVGY